MKKAILYIALFYSFTINAQEDKTVTLTVSGTGKTLEEAKSNALRSAIEQAFGAFISSKTEILNDNLVKDEIVSVSNGNIQKYEIISESVLPYNLGFTTTLKTKVSITKLTSFCENKGMQVEIKGSLFAFNVIQKELSASNEKKVLEELVIMAKNIAPKMFDYTLISGEPSKNEIGSYSLPLKVNFHLNSNWNTYYNIFIKTLLSLCLDKNEINDYNKLNIKTYSLRLLNTKNDLSGNFICYEGALYDHGDGTKISMKEFDLKAWNKISDKQKYKYGTGNFNSNITEKKYQSSNYKVYSLYYRNDIISVIKKIQEIIEIEVYKYNVQSSNGNAMTSEMWNILLNPVTVVGWSENERRYRKMNDNFLWPCGTNHDVNYTGFDKGIVVGTVRAGYRSTLEANSVFLSNISTNSIIGFSYLNIILSLEEIRTLSKLEVKNK
jgi:hypothetical protein